MSLPDLAVAADLSARGVVVTNTVLVAEMLQVASSVVRGAAQSPILATTSTVTLWGVDRNPYLDLPGKPITAVSAVTLDGTALAATDYKLVHGCLWRSRGWGYDYEPLKVVVTLTHGFAEVPAYLVQLVCDLAVAGIKTSADGARDPRVSVEKIDDYSVTFTDDAVASVFELPRATRRALRAQFGGGAAMVSHR